MMAEAAGLVLSAVAFTSLVTSCVDILEYFDNGRHWVFDLDLILTKIDLLKMRLGDLEHSIPLETPSGDPLTLERSECDMTWAASRGLSGVYAVLNRTNDLCKRYSYVPSRVSTAASQTGQSHHHPCHQNGDGKQEAGKRGSLHAWHRLHKKVCWAIHDKKRFETLILDLDFLLSSLERVVFSVQADVSSNSTQPSPQRILDKKVHHFSPAMAQESDSKQTPTNKLKTREPQTASPSVPHAPRDQRSVAVVHRHVASNVSIPRRAETPADKDSMQPLDRYFKNEVEETILVKGGYIDPEGKATVVSPVSAEENKFSRSVVVLGSMTSNDIEKIMKYSVEIRKIQ